MSTTRKLESILRIAWDLDATGAGLVTADAALIAMPQVVMNINTVTFVAPDVACGEAREEGASPQRAVTDDH
jgi:hypothetical protein